MTAEWDAMAPTLESRVAHAFRRPGAPTLKFPLSKAVATLHRVIQHPTSEPEYRSIEAHFQAQLRRALRLEPLSDAEDAEAVNVLAAQLEGALKKILLLANPSAHAQLAANRRHFTMAPVLERLGLRAPSQQRPADVDSLPGLGPEVEWAYDSRNAVAHATPMWTGVDRERRRTGVLVTLVLAAAMHRARLEATLFWPTIQAHVARLLDERLQRDLILRHVTLDATEMATQIPNFELSATEHRWRDNGPPAPSAHHSAWGDAAPLRRGRVLDLVSQIPGLVLLGPPGSGKTTTLRFVALDYAKRLMAKPAASIACPVFVDLKRCRPTTGRGIKMLVQEATSDPELDENLREGRYLLLLDGLNEVQGDERIAAVRDLEDTMASCPQTRFILTSRPGSYHSNLDCPTFVLEAMSDAQIDEYLSRAFSDAEKGATFRAALRRHPGLWDYGRNPLALAMLTRVGAESDGAMPENRGQLMRRFIDWILGREEQKQRQIAKLTKEILLGPLAFAMRSGQARSLVYAEALRVVAEAISALRLNVTADALIAECQDNGLLRVDDAEISFAHELYEEYFAALALGERAAVDPAILEAVSADELWREPMVLLFGLRQHSAAVQRALRNKKPSVAAEALKGETTPPSADIEELAEHVTLGLAGAGDTGETIRTLVTLEDGARLHRWLLAEPGRVKTLGSVAGLPVIALARVLFQVLDSILAAEPAIDPSQLTARLPEAFEWTTELLWQISAAMNRAIGSPTPADRAEIAAMLRARLEDPATIGRQVIGALLPHFPEILLGDFMIFGEHGRRRPMTIVEFTRWKLATHPPQPILYAMVRCWDAGILSRSEWATTLCAQTGFQWRHIVQQKFAGPELQASFYEWLEAAFLEVEPWYADDDSEPGNAKLGDMGADRLVRPWGALLFLEGWEIPGAPRVTTELNMRVPPGRAATTVIARLLADSRLGPRDLIAACIAHCRARIDALAPLRSRAPARASRPSARGSGVDPRRTEPRFQRSADAVDIRGLTSIDEAQSLNQWLSRRRFDLFVRTKPAWGAFCFLDGPDFHQAVFYHPPDEVPLVEGSKVRAAVRVKWVPSKNQWGLVARDVEAALPDDVSGGENKG